VEFVKYSLSKNTFSGRFLEIGKRFLKPYILYYSSEEEKAKTKRHSKLKKKEDDNDNDNDNDNENDKKKYDSKNFYQ
jgi:hypothetical protein